MYLMATITRHNRSPWDVFRIQLQPLNFKQSNSTTLINVCGVWHSWPLHKPSSGALTIALKYMHQFTVIKITFPTTVFSSA